MSRAANTMRYAAALLREDAQAEEESCMVGYKLWTCADCPRDQHGKCKAQHNVENRHKTAAALEYLAEGAK